MENFRFGKMICILLVLCTAGTIASAQAFVTLATLNNTNGSSPLFGPLIQGPGNKLYGTTGGGGAGQNYGGTIFAINPTGALSTVYNFCVQTNCADGEYPYAGLVRAGNGNFYGTTSSGGISSNCPNPTGFGCGTVFEITPAGRLTTLYSFCSQPNCADGSAPQSRLVQARNGRLYGTAIGGGIPAPDGFSGGTVFTITTGGNLRTLYGFCSQISQGSCLDGELPNAWLVQAANGNFYGTTRFGGANAGGTVFEITPAGKLTTLYSFCSQRVTGTCLDGANPHAGLIQAENGTLYGTTSAGGKSGSGTVFGITPGGKETTVYSFCSQANCADGWDPEAGLVQAHGKLYGTTLMGGASVNCTFGKQILGCGTVFEITPAGKLNTLHSFCLVSGCSDGNFPFAALTLAKGRLYGTTWAGGDSSCANGNGCGTVFSLVPHQNLTQSILKE